MCVELTMYVSILSLCRLSGPNKVFSSSVSIKVVWQDNPVGALWYFMVLFVSTGKYWLIQATTDYYRLLHFYRLLQVTTGY